MKFHFMHSGFTFWS